MLHQLTGLLSQCIEPSNTGSMTAHTHGCPKSIWNGNVNWNDGMDGNINGCIEFSPPYHNQLRTKTAFNKGQVSNFELDHQKKAISLSKEHLILRFKSMICFLPCRLMVINLLQVLFNKNLIVLHSEHIS